MRKCVCRVCLDEGEGVGVGEDKTGSHPHT